MSIYGQPEFGKSGTLYDTEPQQEYILKAGAGQTVNEETGFAAYSAIVDNPTGQWVHIANTNHYIPPGVVGFVVRLPGVGRAAAEWAAPPGQSQAAPVAGAFAMLIFTHERLPAGGAITSVGLVTTLPNLTVSGATDLQGDVQIEGRTRFASSDPWFDWTHPKYAGGASPLGLAPAAAQINTCIAEAQAVNGRAFGPPGTYLLDSYLQITAGTVLVDFTNANFKFPTTGAALLSISTINVPVILFMSGGQDHRILGGTMDGTVTTPVNSTCGIVIGPNAVRTTVTDVRATNFGLWPFWVTPVVAGFNGTPTDHTWVRCRSFNSGNTVGPDGGGFKCEGGTIRYLQCTVESSLCFGWDIGTGNCPCVGIDLIDCRYLLTTVNSVGVGIFIETFVVSDVRVRGGEYTQNLPTASQKCIQVYAAGTRIHFEGVTMKSGNGNGAGLYINQGTSTGSGFSVTDCDAYNFAVGFFAGCNLGVGAGSVNGVDFIGNHAYTCGIGIQLLNNAAAPCALTNVYVALNDVRSCVAPVSTAGVFTNGGGAGVKFKDNPGYNPVGPSALVPGASPWTYTNQDMVDEQIYLQGGTVTTLVKGGQTLDSLAGAAIHNRVDVAPGEAFTLTYTVAPTCTKDMR
jgi:hypothetical protein